MISRLHNRLTRTSSDLRTLIAPLLPPSPILRAEHVLVSCSSGEIPILLDPFPLASSAEQPHLVASTDANDCGSTITCDPATKSRGKKGVPQGVPLESSTRPSCNPDPFQSCDAESMNGPPLSSRGDLLRVWESSPVARHQGTYDTGSPPYRSQHKPAILPCTSSQHIGIEGRQSVPSLLADDGTIPSRFEQFLINSFHTYSTLPTPRFALPSPTPSMDLISPISPSLGQRYRRPLERAGAVRLQGRPRSPRLQNHDAESEGVWPGSPTLAVTSTISYPALDVSSLTMPCPSAGLREREISTTTYSVTKLGTLPKELSWLKDTTIELWIDQEGFRAVKHSMQLMGYSPRSRSLQPYGAIEDDDSDSTAGVAEFMPIKREVFAFHYATLDGPPTLRMVSLGGDESRDFVSRQATLSVKCNGVYTVLGAETFSLSVLDCEGHGRSYRSENVRLRWKFDYVVGDRRVDAYGKTLAGEKTLTPLTFSCSPYLFHPLQGKKIGLMHIVKKNFVPKLSSEKLEPPLRRATTQDQLSCEFPQRSLSTHGRSLSDAHAKARIRDEPGIRCLTHNSHLRVGVGEGGTAFRGASRMQYTRRRRASSAGEHSLPISGREQASSQSGNVLLLPCPTRVPHAELAITG
ncbi:hypothetical protein F5I97DRAFT_1808890 [Phlebopus sp. FC_14]|nr:hypothetical protein F5I97DRAFT_1808890 [Phlebopus sp. FC_14]